MGYEGGRDQRVPAAPSPRLRGGAGDRFAGGAARPRSLFCPWPRL